MVLKDAGYDPESILKADDPSLTKFINDADLKDMKIKAGNPDTRVATKDNILSNYELQENGWDTSRWLYWMSYCKY